MGKALTAAQRRAVIGAEPESGRVSAGAQVCAGLARAGLAARHGRGGHHSFYLTAEGRRLRAELTLSAPAPGPQPEPDPGPQATPRGFAADDGTGTGPGPKDAARRSAEVAAAWEGLLQIRAVLLDGATGLPAPWERERCVHSVALALEAAGCPPARPGAAGYAVTAEPDLPGVAAVRWRSAAGAGREARADTEVGAGTEAGALARCARLLDDRGWQCTTHRDRSGRTFLLASPRRR